MSLSATARSAFIVLIAIASAIDADVAIATVVPEFSVSHPGLTSDASNLYLTWEGTDPALSLNLLASPDGSTWNAAGAITMPSDYAHGTPDDQVIGSSIAVLGGPNPVWVVPRISVINKPYISLGVSHDGKVFNWSQFGEGTTNVPAVQYVYLPPNSPQLGVATLFVAWRGLDSKINFARTSLDDPSHHQTIQILDTDAAGAPSFVVDGNTLIFGWCGRKDGVIRLSVSKDTGKNWLPAISLGSTALQAPALSISQHTLYVAWTSPGASLQSRSIWYASAPTTSFQFSAAQPFGSNKSYASPSLAAFKGTVWIAWTGIEKHLNVAPLPGSQASAARITTF